MKDNSALKIINDSGLKDGDDGDTSVYVIGIQIVIMDNGFIVQTEYDDGSMDRKVFSDTATGELGPLGAITEIVEQMGVSDRIGVDEQVD